MKLGLNVQFTKTMCRIMCLPFWLNIKLALECHMFERFVSTPYFPHSLKDFDKSWVNCLVHIIAVQKA